MTCWNWNPPTYTPPPRRASVAAILNGVHSSLHDFRSVGLSHVRRLGNRPAHPLAKHALGIVDFSTWIEENPCFIEQTLLYDLCIFLSNIKFHSLSIQEKRKEVCMMTLRTLLIKYLKWLRNLQPTFRGLKGKLCWTLL